MFDPGSSISASSEHDDLVTSLRALAKERSDLVERYEFAAMMDGPEASYHLTHKGAKWLAERIMLKFTPDHLWIVKDIHNPFIDKNSEIYTSKADAEAANAGREITTLTDAIDAMVREAVDQASYED